MRRRGRTKALYDIRHYLGVLQEEPFRATPGRISHGLRSRRVAILARESRNELARPLDAELRPMVIPSQGVVISRAMAHWLGVSRGTRISIELLEANRPPIQMPVSAIAESYVGLIFCMVFMDRGVLNHLMREGVAAILIFGVVYNNARISLAERARELASMRLLGFSRLEVSYILLGELTLLTLAATPLGWELALPSC